MYSLEYVCPEVLSIVESIGGKSRTIDEIPYVPDGVEDYSPGEV